MILYEYPFNERVRIFLRLEDLFGKFFFFAEQENPLQHHVALTVLFDILDVTARVDLKTDLIHDLEKQKQGLLSLRSHPKVNKAAVDQMVQEIDAILTELTAIYGKVGQPIRSNEWLGSVRSRAAIPGGACEFDLPAYFAWQQRNFTVRQSDLKTWIAPFLPLYEGLKVMLRLLRESGLQNKKITVENGTYQENLSGKTYQLMGVYIDGDGSIFPEISANKYLISIRFHRQNQDLSTQPYQSAVTFEMCLCNNIS